jgi:hypothetical protein
MSTDSIPSRGISSLFCWGGYFTGFLEILLDLTTNLDFFFSQTADAVKPRSSEIQKSP